MVGSPKKKYDQAVNKRQSAAELTILRILRIMFPIVIIIFYAKWVVTQIGKAAVSRYIKILSWLRLALAGEKFCPSNISVD